MPHSTVGYPFEGKVFAFAQQLSERLAGNSGECKFLMRLDANGAVTSIELARPIGGDYFDRDQLEAEDGSYLYYDPFDAPIYTWICWNRIACATMERLMAAPFEEQDFVQFAQLSSRVGTLDPPGAFPESHGVMF
jgi:hypothetical protein